MFLPLSITITDPLRDPLAVPVVSSDRDDLRIGESGEAHRLVHVSYRQPSARSPR